MSCTDKQIMGNVLYHIKVSYFYTKFFLKQK